ncbi:MAG: hypothetical protein HY880_03480 [Deltaproteobacteria bacterium]|nr:hypothetical protein [Deltaproteobacteria bacterium]
MKTLVDKAFYRIYRKVLTDAKEVKLSLSPEEFEKILTSPASPDREANKTLYEIKM